MDWKQLSLEPVKETEELIEQTSSHLENTALVSAANANMETPIVEGVMEILSRLDSVHHFLHDDKRRTSLNQAELKGRLASSTTLESIEMVNSPDDEDGNTILHPATEAKHTKTVNWEGFTSLDMVDQSDVISNSDAPLLTSTSENDGGGKMSSQLFLPSPIEIPLTINTTTRRSLGRPPENSLNIDKRPAKFLLHSEHLQNVGNTITITVALIVTLAYSAGISAPCDVHKETVLGVKSMLGRTTSYKVLVCNNVAFLLSLGIVSVLYGVIPFEHKSMLKLLVVIQKIMWVSVSFMVAAYIAVTWMMITHSGKGRTSLLEALVTIGGRCILILLVGLGTTVVKHQLRKKEWETDREKESAPMTKRMQCDIGSKVHNYIDTFLLSDSSIGDVEIYGWDPDGHPVC